MVRRLIVAIVLTVGVLTAFGMVAAQDATTPGPLFEVTNEYTMATVVKVTGIAWFDRMEEGIGWFAQDFPSVTAFQQGPAEADAAQQVQVIEDLVAQGVDSLCVIPFQPETVEPVLQRAREQGIVVITHESSAQQNIDFDIEAFDNAAFGRNLMDNLAERMNFEGEYTVFVGSLTSKTHNEWVDSAIAHQIATYPNMTLVGDKNESFDDPQVAYERMQELLVQFPNLRGVQGSASTDVAGVGQAVEEAGLQDDIAVVGTSLPSIARDLIPTGAVDMISFWDPAYAGYACNMLGLMMLEGTMPSQLTDGTGLPPFLSFGFPNLPGYGSMSLVDGKVFYGSAWVEVTADNLADYDF